LLNYGQLVKPPSMAYGKPDCGLGVTAPSLEPPPSPLLHQLRPWSPQDWAPPARCAPQPDSNLVGSPRYVGTMPTLVSLALKGHRDIAMPQQLGGREWLAPGHPECPADLALDSAVARIREGCPLGACLCHVSRISAPTAHCRSYPVSLRRLQLISWSPATRRLTI
jgi:hypothetical protein